MKAINAIRMGHAEILPLVEGGKGIAISDGVSAGRWAASGGVGTLSAVNADGCDAEGRPIQPSYHGRSRTDRHEELVAHAIDGGVAQARLAHELAGGRGRVHANIMWEMAGSERIITAVLDKARGLIHGLTCGAGMPYRLGEIAARFNIHYYPIVSSARAFNALWRRAYHRFAELLGGVVYEDPWLAGGHNGLSHGEDPARPEDPFPRVHALRKLMRSFGLGSTPIIMAGNVWWLEEWADWIDNPDLGPIAFQFGTRPLLTRESPIGSAWKNKLLTLKPGDVFLNRFSPTGFYSSAINNGFIRELRRRSDRQVAYAEQPDGDREVAFRADPRKREVYVSAADRQRVEAWRKAGFTEAMPTPEGTLIFVTPERARRIRADQSDCTGCLNECRFSTWSQHAANHQTGRKADPRSYCIQKTLQTIAHEADSPEVVDDNLMFSGHSGFRFATDPFYSNGFIPTVRQLIERILTGR